MPSPDKLLAVENLRVHFRVYEGTARAVDGVSFSLDAGEIVGIVGESACGKSVTSMAIPRLIPCPPATMSGSIKLNGVELTTLPAAAMQRLRGKEIAMIFQEPQSALNPVFTIENQMSEMIQAHEPSATAASVRERVLNALREVRIPDPESRLRAYPHELSGGMKQRVMIAMAMLLNPKLLIADEPTTALDVTIQRQILDLIADLRERHGIAVILITHDLGIVAQVCRRVIVMYAGHIVEEAPVAALFKQPGHPYSAGLMRARPRIHKHADRLEVIPGRVPPGTAFPDGCRFAPRCSMATDRCRTVPPPLEPFGDDPLHRVACYEAKRMLAMA